METKVQETARELLSRAAKTLRETARNATPGPWEHVDHGKGGKYMGCGQVITWAESVEGGSIAAPSGDMYPRGGYSPDGDMAHIALMHPPVALALAALFEQHAGWLAQADDDTPADAADLGDIGHVVEVARTVLRIGGAR